MRVEKERVEKEWSRERESREGVRVEKSANREGVRVEECE